MPAANDWDAAVATGNDGSVWVAWDGYATGNYEVYMRRVNGAQMQPVIRVTHSTRFHAHPSLAVDVQNRVWIAYDEAPENWGKDLGFLFSGGTGLYQSRTIQVAMYAGGRWMAPLRQPDGVAPWGFKRFVQTPRLAAAPDGRIWLVFRPRIESRFPTSNWQAGGKWEVCATYYSGDRWSDLIYLQDSVGRNEGEFAAAPDTHGNIWVAMVTDHKLYGGPEFGEFPGNNDVMVARLQEPDNAAAPASQLAERPPEPPAGLANEPDEKRDIADPAQLLRSRPAERPTKSIAGICTGTPRSRSMARETARYGMPTVMGWTPRVSTSASSLTINRAARNTPGGELRRHRTCSTSPDFSRHSMAPSAA